MELTYKKNIPFLKIDNYKIEGWDKIPKNYPNKKAIVFSNDLEDDFLTENLYELIKKYKISDIEENIEFIIEDINLGKKPKILELIPYPFWGIKISISQNQFIITFEMIQEIGFDYEWDKKWTNEFYFDNISRELKLEQDLIVEYQKEDFITLDLSVKVEEEIIENAVKKAIERMKKAILKVESSINGLTGFFEVIEIWNNKKINKSEMFWHKLLKKYSWLLSLIINEPTIIVDDEAYIGGKSLHNKKGKIIDFIYQNKLSKNLALIEIKTPQTKILGQKYRQTYSLSNQLTGAINQLLEYKDQFQKNYYSLKFNSNIDFNLVSPNLYLIIGNQENLSREEKECFENFRKNFKGITLITSVRDKKTEKVD